MTLTAFARIWSQSSAWTATGSKSGATRPMDAAPFMRKSAALSRSTPDVGLSFSIGSAFETALTQLLAPATPGKIFCKGAPSLYALNASVGVWQPGTTTICRCTHHSTTSGMSTGVMMNSAPASQAASASAVDRIVPQPTMTSPSYFWRKSARLSSALGVVSVNSAILNPPSIAAVMALGAASAVAVRSTAQTRSRAKRSRTDS
mmetsp:Transcript_28621/g.88522  ORF Transcript_28621/g.88522 Transcript_28621/m.88522 type:complete len:204 (+) Transcript_28621:150-761(+)